MIFQHIKLLIINLNQPNILKIPRFFVRFIKFHKISNINNNGSNKSSLRVFAMCFCLNSYLPMLFKKHMLTDPIDFWNNHLKKTE